MALICKCIQKQHQAAKIDEGFELNEIDLLSAGKYLRKVGLKIGDVKMKIGINKIIHFMQRLSEQVLEKSSLIDHIQKQESIYCQISQIGDDKYQEANKQNNYYPIEPESFIGINTSKSFLSEANCNQQHFSNNSRNNQLYNLSKLFKFKQVVTKNQLEQPACTHHVRFKSIQSAAESDHNDQIMEKLQVQNQNLQKCLKNIFHFFEEKRLLSFEGRVKDLKKNRYIDIVDQLACNYVDYTNQIEENIANLQAKSSLLQETIHNMSISMRIQKSNVQKEEDYLCREIQTQEQPYQTNVIAQTKKQLNNVTETLRKNQLIIFIKDEQIFSLKVMISDLENKLKGLTKCDQTVRSKSYKKYFQITGQNLNKTVR